MAWVNKSGVRIHYQVVGNGPPLVLQHGLTQSLEDWIECGYVAALATDYRLILIDARGHGLSDKPSNDADYALPLRVADVVAVLDALDIGQSHFWGYSMGGFIGFGMACHAPARLDRLIIGGSHPFARDPEANRNWLRKAMPGGERLVQAVRSFGGNLPRGYTTRLASLDVAPLMAATPAGQSMAEQLPSIAAPCLLYCGDADPAFESAQRGAALIPRATFVSLPSLGHLDAFIDSAVVLPSATAFLQAG